MYKKPLNFFSRWHNLRELWAKNRQSHAPFGPDKRIYGYHYRDAHNNNNNNDIYGVFSVGCSRYALGLFIVFRWFYRLPWATALHRLLAAVVRFSISIRLFCNLFRILVNFSFFSQYHSTCCLFRLFATYVVRRSAGLQAACVQGLESLHTSSF